MRAGALADKAVLDAWVAAKFSLDQAQQALAIAREVEDPALVTRALTACGAVASYYDREVARSYFAEAIGLARGDRRPVEVEPDPRLAGAGRDHCG